MTLAKRLLMVDDDPDICDFVRNAAEPLGFDVATHTKASTFMASLNETGADVLLIDLSMPKVDGIELLSQLAQCGTRAKIFVMSGFNPAIREAAMRLGHARGLNMRGVIPKPVRLAAIRELLSAARDG